MANTRKVPGRLLEIILAASIILAVSFAVFANRKWFKSADISGTDSGETPAAGSGASIETPLLFTNEELRKRSLGFILKRRNLQKEIYAMRKEEAERRNEIATQREDCADEARRANRDTKFPIQKRCFRSLLTLDLENLRKETTSLENIPGITPETLEAHKKNTYELMDAISLIIDGIDSGVYADEESLIESKLNLAEKFREPYRASSAKIQQDVLLTWISHLVNKAVNADISENLEAVSAYVKCLNNVELAIKSNVGAPAYSIMEECIGKVNS